MSIYAIGDVQGCVQELEKLLAQINFNAAKDTLWFTGDLVNRGPFSLEVLRLVKSLGENHVAVLGNHDLHLLALAYGTRTSQPGDTLAPILTAPDRDELIDWLRHRPLMYHAGRAGHVLVHAGLAPSWTVNQAKLLAQEVETELRGHSPALILKNMFGNQPDHWDDRLSGTERLRCIINFFTRMRFCDADGRLALSYKVQMADKPSELVPWFDVPDRVNAHEKIIFGHWAALGGKVDVPNVYALDTGCVWGNCLTAMRLDDYKRFSVRCSAWATRSSMPLSSKIIF